MNKVRIRLLLLKLVIISCFLVSSCGGIEFSDEVEQPEAPEGIYLDFLYDFDEAYESNDPHVYVLWLENMTTGKTQHIYVCERVTNGTLDAAVYDTALPFWHVNLFDDTDSALMSEIDAVTGPTIPTDKNNGDVAFSVPLDEDLGNEFSIFFELDQSFQFNDWFGGPYLFDQQAILYRADIDLSNGNMPYSLVPVGWTPNQDYTVAGVVRTTGVLVSEMDFIEKHRIDDAPTFGTDDSGHSAMRTVVSITATIKGVQ